MIDPSNENIFL